MPKQNLNEVRSSPTHSRDNRISERKKPTVETVPAQTYLNKNPHCHAHYNGKYHHHHEDSEDRRLGIFRNRLFSTWVDQLPSSSDGLCRKGKCYMVQWEAKEDENEDLSKRQESISSQEDSLDADVDGGYAWMILIVMFVINASTFGTARAYGLIFENSARRAEQSRSEAALPFTIMGAIENMAGPLAGYLLARTGSWRVVVLIGSCLITLSHVLAAYFESQPGQILTIGIMCGIGQSLISISSFQINNAYFVRYRSRAFGIGLTGAAVGTIYISPLCQYVLDSHGKSLCYLMLSFILFPNVPLSLLLKPKETTETLVRGADNGSYDIDSDSEHSKSKFVAPQEVVAKSTLTQALAGSATGFVQDEAQLMATIRERSKKASIFSISHGLTSRQSEQVKAKIRAQDQLKEGFWCKASSVLLTPLFHLIWPTQLLFCWLNFVFGMIITDFGKDRGLNETQNSHLIVIWASGQLFGRLCLGSLVDLRILSHKLFTIVCLASISMITCLLNNLGSNGSGEELTSSIICLLIFTLSMFISTLYILFNGLVFDYMDKSLTALSIGISSFTGSFFLLPRANIIGYYRDTSGNYDAMLTMFTYVTMLSALVWLIVPPLCSYLGGCNRTRIAHLNLLLNDCRLSSQTISIGRPDVVEQG